MLHVQLSPKEEAAHKVRALEVYHQRAADNADTPSDKNQGLLVPQPITGGT